MFCTSSLLHYSSALFIFCLSFLSLISHCAFCDFPFSQFTSFSVKTTNPTKSLHISFIHTNLFSYTSNHLGQKNASGTESPTIQEPWFSFANWIVTEQLIMKSNSGPSIRFPGIQHRWITSTGSRVDFSISHFGISAFLGWRVSTLHVTIAKKEFSLVLAPPSHMTTDGDHSLHQKVFFAFWHFDILHVTNSYCEASRLSKLRSLKWSSIVSAFLQLSTMWPQPMTTH